jgi:hypothetical protein
MLEDLSPIFAGMDETSFAYIALARWLPSILTVVLGGYVASVLFPRLQRKFQKASQEEERKRQIAEEVVQAFSRYVISWRRLIQISRLERERDLSESEIARKREFVSDRKEQRDLLVDKLRLCELYYCGEVCTALNGFLDWDELQSLKTLDDLPDISDWRDYERKLVGLIKNELAK